MNTSNNTSIFNYHRAMIACYGNTDHAALGWTDRQSQQIRFSVLAEMTHLDKHHILDAGCGHGDLLHYLLPRCPNIRYTGLEQIPELLEEALRRHGPSSAAKFIMGDFMQDDLPIFDFVLASGSLNYRQNDPDFIHKAIAKLYQSSATGLGFNLLRKIIPNGLITAYQPEKIVAYCKTLSPDVRLRTDYSQEDFTVYMYR